MRLFWTLRRCVDDHVIALFLLVVVTVAVGPLVHQHAPSSIMSEYTVDATYEATKARQSTWAQPDKIHWSRENSFRNCPYRQLHHQNGIIGRFHVRLLEATSLKRSYWSALALGPVKHLGLSKAHGPISSYAVMYLNTERVQSPVVANNDHPVWTSASYSLLLKKGALVEDGLPVLLNLEMMEDATAAEQMGLPGVPSPQDRMLGTGSLDITSLCLGQDEQGRLNSGVMDVWIPISKNTSGNKNTSEDKQEEEEETGRVRVLVSYTPNGLDPQPNDLVALEAFARRSLRTASCRPILSQPLMPMRVLQVRENYLLCEYSMNHQDKATMRIHRNAVFVIERVNFYDGAINIVLTPTDFVLQTPVGRTTCHMAQPVVEATRDLLQPGILGMRVLWAAVRTTTFAGMTGVQAATHAVWRESRDAQERRDHQASFHKTPPRNSQSFV